MAVVIIDAIMTRSRGDGPLLLTSSLKKMTSQASQSRETSGNSKEEPASERVFKNELKSAGSSASGFGPPGSFVFYVLFFLRLAG